MEDKSNISIFQGSTVEADAVQDFLAQQGIASLIRNHMQETLDAGWLTATPDHAAEIFVAIEDQARALELLKNLYQGEQSQITQRPVEPKTEQQPAMQPTTLNRPQVTGSQSAPPAAERKPTTPPTIPPAY